MWFIIKFTSSTHIHNFFWKFAMLKKILSFRNVFILFLFLNVTLKQNEYDLASLLAIVTAVPSFLPSLFFSLIHSLLPSLLFQISSPISGIFIANPIYVLPFSLFPFRFYFSGVIFIMNFCLCDLGFDIRLLWFDTVSLWSIGIDFRLY